MSIEPPFNCAETRYLVECALHLCCSDDDQRAAFDALRGAVERYLDRMDPDA